MDFSELQVCQKELAASAAVGDSSARVEWRQPRPRDERSATAEHRGAQVAPGAAQ